MNKLAFWDIRQWNFMNCVRYVFFYQKSLAFPRNFSPSHCPGRIYFRADYIIYALSLLDAENGRKRGGMNAFN